MPERDFFIKSDEVFYDPAEGMLFESKVSAEIFPETVSLAYLSSKYGEEPCVPVEIFSGSLAPLQALVKYAKDHLKLENKEISRLLGRDAMTIWLTYRNAKKKQLPSFSHSKLLIPLSIFNNSSLSILESLVSFLSSAGMKNARIATVLKKDQRTTWTVKSRAKRKRAQE